MAGLCSYNFTVGFYPQNPDVMNDGHNKLKGGVGQPYDTFLGYKNERWDYGYESDLSTNLLIIKQKMQFHSG